VLESQPSGKFQLDFSLGLPFSVFGENCQAIDVFVAFHCNAGRGSPGLVRAGARGWSEFEHGAGQVLKRVFVCLFV
jgi:hypothetical protein